MYNIPNISVRTIAIIIIAIAVFGIGIFAALHGSIITTEKTTLRYATSSQTLSSSVNESKNTRTTVPSGNYGIIASKNGTTVISSVSAPHFLFANSAFQSPKKHNLTVVGRQTDPDIAKENSKLVSYTDNTIHPLSKTNIDGDENDDHIDNDIPDFSSSFQTSPSTIGGLVDNQESILPVSYNISSNSTQYYPSLQTSIDDISTQVIDNGFMVFNKKTSEFSVYQVDKSDPIRIKIDSSSHISKYNGNPVYSYAHGVLAVVVGPDYNQVNEDENPSATDEPGDSSLLLINTKNKKTIRTIDFSRSILTNILLSKNAKNIAVQTSEMSGIYDTATGKLGFMLPTTVDNILWKDDTTFAFTTATDGVFIGSAADKTAANILPYVKLRPTNLAFFDGADLYFTGYGTAAEGNDKPDAFRYATDSSQSKTNQQIFTTFPHQGNNYYVDAIGNTITIQTTRYITDSEDIVDTDAEKAAKQYIKDHIDNLDGYTIKTTYVDNDLRQNDDED